MVYDAITIEPGIYHDGWFGIRIEDDFLVNQEGHEFLTAEIPRDLAWFMIVKEDFNQQQIKDVEDGEESFLPYPVGVLEMTLIVAFVAFTKRDEE
jgi:hypothetical protein